MGVSYDSIYKKAREVIDTYKSRDPKDILERRGVHLIAFKSNTRLLGMYKIIKGVSFVFYNPFVDERIQNMVFAHELGHHIFHEDAAANDLIEYELFDINSEMELEANIFSAHFLLDEEAVYAMARAGYSYMDMARAFSVDVNLMIFKLNEMQRMGYDLPALEAADNDFFRKIDGRKLPRDL